MMQNDDDQKKPIRKVRKPAANVSYRRDKGLYHCDVGKHVSPRTNKPTSTRFYLGPDELQAQIKRKILRAEWVRIRNDGALVWDTDTLNDLAEKGIVSGTKAGNHVEGEMIQQITETLPLSPAQQEEELKQFRQPDGLVKTDAFLPFYLTVYKQELTSPDIVNIMRKAIRTEAKGRPLKALEDAFKLHVLATQPKNEGNVMQVNVGGILAADASEVRRARLAAITGEAVVEESGNSNHVSSDGDAKV